MKAAATVHDPLLTRAITGVMQNAEDGELPLFAATLGMHPSTLQAVLAWCAPERLASQPMTDADFPIMLPSPPEPHAALVNLMLAGRSPQANPQHAEWLAYAIAAAASGSRHLWEDLGVSGREDVSALLRRYFEPLFLRNTADLKWKHFLFAELANVAGHDSSHDPDCTRCSKQQRCFPTADARP